MNRDMWNFHVLVGLFVLVGILSSNWYIEAFNVETRHYTSYRKEQSSMFGFSVAEHRDRNKRGWVIVGAPQAQTAQVNVYRGGAVYRCDVAKDDQCVPIVFDTKEHNVVKRPTEPHDVMRIDNKTLQWFGATVSTSYQDGGPILACAPRYVFFGVGPGYNVMNDSHGWAFGNQRDPVGTCFVSTNPSTPSTVREFSPCRTKNYGYHKQGSCQAGFSAALSKDGERVFVGAPGSWYWQGQMYTQLVNNRDKVLMTKESPKWEDDSYLGYSITPGDFVGKGEDNGIAVGMPRGADLHGKIVLFTSKMVHVRNITGEQMGSYFGYAIAAGDIDSDGYDDLIVGAPMFTVPENTEMNFETGRIYVFYGKGPVKYDLFHERDGESNRGRFGLSLAYLGDIDRDGYGDVAVGAPYAGSEGRGAVYIYQGSAEGISSKYSQAIYAEELPTRVQTFGFSIAGGLDLDGNLYPDIVVGSYETGAAMFFRSRPVIKMVPNDTYVNFYGGSSHLISLDDKQCVLSDGTRVTCLQLRACFKYTGDGVLSRYNFNVQYALDVKKTKSPRMCFLELEGRHTMNQTITVDRNQQYCRTVKVYVTPNIRDKLTSLDAEMRIGLADERWVDDRERDPSLILRPVMATTSSRKDTVSIFKNCGSDNICTPDLQMTCKSNVAKYLLGSDKRIELDVTVQNAYEDAFEATYNLVLPPGIDYIKIERLDKAEIPVHCSAPRQSNNNTLKCDIGNPLPNGNLVRFTVLLQPMSIQEEISSYEFAMEVNSSNSEPFSTTHDNKQHLSLKIWVETEMLIEGESKPKDLFYNPENYTSTNITTELEYGPAFIHNYTIRNRGPSRIEEAEIYLRWPAATLANDDLVYLLEQPETSGPIVCGPANANPLSLKLEQKYRISHGPGRNSGRPTEKYPGTYDSGEGILPGAVSPRPGGGHATIGGSIHEENKTHSVVTGANGEVTIIDDDWSNRGGIVTTVNVSRTLSQQDYEEKKRQEEEIERIEIERIHEEKRRIETERRRQEEEERSRQGPKDYVYGTERHYENSDDSLSHGVVRGGTSVLSTGISHNEGSISPSISGNREETVGLRDFDYRLRNITTAQDLDRILATLTKDAVGYEVYNREGKKYLQFLGRFRISEDNKEYIEFKSGAMFPLENRYGAPSYADGSLDAQSRFLRIEGLVVVTEDGRGYIQLKDGRRFPIEGSYSYTEERTYTTHGGGGAGVSQIGSRGSFTTRTENYRNVDGDTRRQDQERSWREESSNYGREGNTEFETHRTESHEEKRTYDSQHGSRTYSRNENTGDFDHRNSKLYGAEEEFRKRGLRQRREQENDDSMSVQEFRKIEKQKRHHKREAFQLDDDFSSFPASDGKPTEETILPLCEAARCVTLRCTLGRLEKDEEAWISARYRVKAATLKKIAFHEELKVSTQIISKVTRLPSIGKPATDIIKSHEIFTNLQPKAVAPEPEVVPLWVVVLSACAGTIILLLLILLLHKCGFFKRNRPTDAPERQPLNRNGHFHGDDHL
ncbi:integrin alpha-PS2 isoform X2 [Venturia canescens]|uniref:integrin alpha-PS2 isoform X2 n=1 Tax=Venturia canescens TaxID=32260 RepID=UPI001C9C0ADE|nr:integrin alpha-PS2-like isoform X2 [Venturia canescens]